MLRDILDPIITKAITPQNLNTLKKGIVGFVDKNSEILMSLDMSKRYSFSDADRAIIYNTIGVSEDFVIGEIAKSKYINKSNKIHSNPFYIICFYLMHVLLSQKKEKEAHDIMTYMSIMMYTSAHKGRFKYLPNKQIMDYTIAHLDNSFKIKSMPSIFAFIEDNTQVTFDTYKSRILRADDKDATWVNDALWTRLKGKINKIGNAFRKNYEEGRYLNADSESLSEEDYHEIDNNSFMVERLSNRIHIKLLNHQINDRLIKYSINRSDISFQKLKNLIDDIIMDDEENKVKKVISSIIEYFLTMSGYGYDYIARGEFISYMKTAYASNTDLEQMTYIKKTLDYWLDTYVTSLGRANYGKTAKSGYKKAIYMFLVFVINGEAKIR